jgi:conjugative relaxase-like TrwC/TraI family protein
LRTDGRLVTFACVQTTSKIAGPSATGYAGYMTSESGRGDYYAGHEEDEGGGGVAVATVGQSRWHGSPELLAELGLSQDGPVEQSDLLALMNGVSPVDGRELRAAGGNGTRVAGVDLTFSAPKTVSALWAVSGPEERGLIELAHSNAVSSALERVERDVEMVRSREGGKLHNEKAASVLAAEFVHTSSRLTVEQERGGVPDPQLHSHVVVLGAERVDGRFAAVDSRELYRAARANGAWYRSQLANQLQQQGVQVQGRTGRDGRYFEVKGVPEGLTERWSARTQAIQRAAAQFRDRYGRDPKAGELGSLTISTRGTKTTASAVNVHEAWQAVGEEYGFSQEQANSLFTGIDQTQPDLSGEQSRDLARDLVHDLTSSQSMVRDRDLYARAYELSTGICEPAQADLVIEDLVQSGELIALQGGMWTTRELREREQSILNVAESRAGERAAPVSEQALTAAQQGVEREISAPLSVEQREALQTITGEGGVSVLVGQAGTGKGVVLSAAASAWEQEGYTVIGTAIAGATAERLGADANLERSLNTSALLAGLDSGRTHIGPDTVVVMDEAGMADTNRLARLTELTARGESKLLLVGDQAQLSAIGVGGMFTALQERVPTAELTEVHRAQHEWEREAWAQLRAGESQRALAGYQAHERLHIADTRQEAAERMVSDWAAARRESPGERTVMLTDASNVELDRINALAQEQRAQAGELGADRVELPDRGYGLAAGDQMIFTAALYPPGQQRVENGTLGTVTQTEPESG